MRRIIGMLTMLACISAGCDDDDTTTNQSENANVESIEARVDNGQWRITSFVDSGRDETGSFADYIFDFGSSNVVTASNGSNNVMGNWQVTEEDNSNDDTSNEYDGIDFLMSFTSPENFTELNEDWEILSLSDTKIELRHVSGGNGGTDLLTFEKI